jgi:WD40 repeat protein
MPAVMNSGSCSPFPKEKEESLNHCVYMFSRSSLISKPVAIIPNLKKPCIAIRWNPIQYQLTKKDPLVDLPYRYIYALATQDSVYIYDTQQLAPLAYLSQLHYSTFTDLAWSCDGLCLVVTSTDGFSSLVIFDAGELGIPVETNVVKEDVSNCSVNVVGSIVDSIVDSAAGPLEEVVDDSVIEYVKMHMDVDKPVDQNLSHSGMLNLKAVNILQESMQNATNVKSSMDTNVKSSMDANVKEDENTMADVKDVKVNENVKADGTDVKKIKRIVPTLVSAGTQ